MQPDGLHGTEAQGFASTARHFFDGHAPFEVGHRVELVRGELVGGGEGVNKRFILVTCEGAVEIRPFVAGAVHRFLAPARGAEGDALVDRLE